MVRGRGRSETTRQRRTRRASAAEGTGTRREVVRGENAGGVRLGARRERRRTMMGDSYFTSVSTGGIGMAPGLLRRKRTARRSLSQSRARVPTQTALGKSERKALLSFRFLPTRVPLCQTVFSTGNLHVRRRANRRRVVVLVWAFTLSCCLTFTFASPMTVCARGERVTAQRAALIRVVARQGPDHAPSVSSS